MSSASAFTIRELGGRKRTLRLMGRALPKRPYTLVVAQREQTDWYPGHPDATQQVLGRELPPTTIEGVWNDRFLAEWEPIETSLRGISGTSPIARLDEGPVSNARDLVDVVDSICSEGQQIEVTWDRTIRVGLLKDFTQKWLRGEDVEWGMTFKWAATGLPTAPSVFRGSADYSEIARDFAGELVILAGEGTPDFAEPEEFRSLRDTVLGSFRDSVDSLEGAISNTVNLVNDELSGARSVASVVVGMFDETDKLVDFLDEHVATALDVSSFVDGSFPMAAVVRAEMFARRLRRRGNEIKASARQASLDIGKRVHSDIIATVVAAAGDDLRDVAQEWYGDPEEWKALAFTNHLESSALTAGQVLFIPATPGA